MRFEHHAGVDTDSLLSADADPAAKRYVTEGETLCCTIEAETWEEAMAKYRAHLTARSTIDATALLDSLVRGTHG